MLSAAVLWLLSGLTAPVPAGWRWAGVLLVAALGLLRQLGLIRIPLPQNGRQVPQDVLQRHLLLGSLRFGIELGTGVRTFVSASAPYVLAAGLLLVGHDLRVAVLAGLGFGAGRAATPLLRHLSRADARWDADLHDRLRIITVGSSALTLLAVALPTLRVF